MHQHTWHIFSTDVQARTLTVFCLCGLVGEVQRVSPDYFQGALEGQAAQAEWEGPVREAVKV